jgi:pilus assembly protein Flp/PilA
MTISPFTLIKRFAREERGASLVEYSVLVGIITAAVVTALTLLSTEIVTAFDQIRTVISAN